MREKDEKDGDGSKRMRVSRVIERDSLRESDIVRVKKEVTVDSLAINRYFVYLTRKRTRRADLGQHTKQANQPSTSFKLTTTR